MSEYPDLFDPAANRAFARNTDPETSHDAADALAGKALTRLESIVVAALAAQPAGLTITEIADASGIEAQTISPRMAPLADAGRIVDSGVRRIPEGRTKRAIVWMVAPPGTVPPGRRPRPAQKATARFVKGLSTGVGLVVVPIDQLRAAREYVGDALDAHEHSDGRELLRNLDAILAAAEQEAG